MQRKTLEDLGLTKEQVDTIMAEHGKGLEKAKQTLTEQLNQSNESLKQATDTLKSFEGVDVKELQGKITALSKDLEQKETDHQAKIQDMEFQTSIDNAIGQVKGKNAKAIKSLLDVDSLRASKNQQEDIQKALTELKTNDSYLFESTEPFTSPTGQSNPTPQPSPLASIRSAMGLNNSKE